MPSISGYSPTIIPQAPLQSQQGGQASARDNTDIKLETQIARQVASAAPGADVNVQYNYAPGPDGQLQVTGATVTVTEKAPTPERLGGTGEPSSNRIDNINDIVDIETSDGGKDKVGGLSPEEREAVRELALADAAIRRHEGLHFRAAGGLGNLPEYQTVTGPDGRQYAVAGSVGVSGTRGADPEQAAREAETLELAATAPGDASAQDLAAARQFAQNGAAASTQANSINEQNNQNTNQEQPNNAGESVDIFI